MDLEKLLSSSPKDFIDPAKLFAPLMPFIIAIVVVLSLIALLYIVNVINAWRSHRATIEIRDILREMNQRERDRS